MAPPIVIHHGSNDFARAVHRVLGPAKIQLLMTVLRLSSYLSSQTDPFCRSITAQMTEMLDRSIEFYQPSSWLKRLRALDAATVQIAWVCGLPYSRWADQQSPPFELIAAPVMTEHRYAGQPNYFSDIVVRKESSYKSFDDLRNTSWAYNEPNSFSGYVIIRAHLAVCGADGTFFNRWIASGSHLKSLELVINGEVEAAAIDSMVIDMASEVDPGLKQKIRVVATLGPNRAPPWVISRNLPLSVREQVRAWFCSLHKTPAGQALMSPYRISRFTQVIDKDYDRIRALARLADSLDC